MDGPIRIQSGSQPVPPRPGMADGVAAVDILAADGHVHSTWSDGTSTTRQNLDAALAAGLSAVTMVDHVRATSDWLPGFVREVRGLARDAPIDVRLGVETKLMDAAGRLDLPQALDALDDLDVVLIADHRFPGPGGPVDPGVVAGWIRSGAVRGGDVARDLVAAMTAALGTLPIPAVLAHPFSLLPKMGLSEADLPQEALLALAVRCRETGTPVECNEKWRCPGPSVVALLRAEGVRLVAGSDAHAAPDVGRWDWVRGALEAGSSPGAGGSPGSSA